MKDKKKATDRFRESVAEFLRAVGWMPVVAGGISIEARPPLTYNFRLVIDFTGTKNPGQKARSGGDESGPDGAHHA